MNTAALQIDAGIPLPEVYDDYLQMAAGEPVVMFPLGEKIDLAARGWELTLLNDPQGGIATVTSDGAVKFTPNPGFVGSATIHYLVADQQHNDSSASVTLEFQNDYAAKSERPLSETAAAHVNQSGDVEGVVASKVFSLVADALFAGTAQPHTEVVGRIYKQCGTMAGESIVTADTDGLWETHFAGTQALEFYRVEFEQVAAEGNASGKIALQPNEAAWQAI